MELATFSQERESGVVGRLRVRLAAVSAVLALTACGGGRDESAGVPLQRLPAASMPDGAAIPAGPSQVLRLLQIPEPAGAPRSESGLVSPSSESGHRSDATGSRGEVAQIYARVAPSVVVIRTDESIGSGFVVDSAGWIVTNQHVIRGATYDPASNAQVVTVHFGTLEDDLMVMSESGMRALVYATSEDKDLALLELAEPHARLALRPLAFAGEGPRPGEECVAIGHPKAAMLWSVRRCQIAGIGDWPRGMIDVVLRRLALAGEQKAQFDAALRNAPHRKVVVSTCGISPGDSGGPLLDREGQVIAVTFAIPRADEAQDPGVNLDKFSYHVHRDEVRDFLAARPPAPRVAAPDPWPAAALAAAADLDQDGEPETVFFGTRPGGPAIGFMVDLDQNGSQILKAGGLAEPSFGSTWDFEFAAHLLPVPRTFYDTDDDGVADLVLNDTDGDHLADSALRLVDGEWSVEPGRGRPLIDPSLVVEPASAERLTRIVAAITEAAEK